MTATRLTGITRGVARLYLAAHGATTDQDAGRVLDEAAKFPGRWAYTTGRAAAAVWSMPARVWTVADTRESEERIAAIRRAHGW